MIQFISAKQTAIANGFAVGLVTEWDKQTFYADVFAFRPMIIFVKPKVLMSCIFPKLCLDSVYLDY